MAIYHVHISSGSRADGQAAAVKVAYILREGAYGGRDDLVCWGSGNMPSWAAADPRQLFEAADLYERLNGRLFLHVWVALPNELTDAERHELGLAIAAALTAAGLPFVYAVHAGDPKSPGEPANPHIHIVISERINDNIPRDARQWFRRANPREPARGGAAKDRRLKEVTWVDDSRRVVARLTNEHLAVAGCKARVTADSHEVRIVEAEAWGDTETADVLRRHPPGVHLGPAAAAIERERIGGKRDEAPKVLRQGEPTERGDLARAKAAEEERVRGELERVSAKLRRAREEEVRATESVAAARSAGLSEDRILAVYEESESTAEGSGWAAVEEAASSEAGRKKEAEGAAALLGIDVESVVRVALEQDADPVAALEAVVASFEAARSALLSDEAIEGIRCEAESGEPGSGWAAVAEAARRRLAWKARAEPAAREAGIADVEVVYAAALSRGEDPLAALESVTAARLERKKQAENAAGETGIIDIETEYGRARDVGEDPLSMLERATNVVVAARAALVTDETIQAQHAAAESRERGSGWRAVEKASQTRSAWKGRAEAAARAAGIADVEAVYAAALSRGEDPLAALEAATAARQAAARRRAAVEGREATIRATRVGADWLLEAEQRVLRAADRRPTLEEREGIAETVERRIREHLDSRLEALAVTDAGAELLEQTRADASAATLAAQERVIELAEQRLEEHLAEQQRLFAQPVGEDLFTAHLAARDPAWRPGDRTTAENRTAALRAAEAEGARLARARDVFDGRWSRRHYRSAAGARFTLADVDAALTAAESFADRVAGLSEGTGLAVLAEAVAAGGELTVADLEAAVERAEQAERQAARREELSAGGRELYAVRLAALAAADQRAGETPSGAVVDQALDETESDEARLPRLDALFEDAELRSYYRGTLGPAGDQHQVTLEQLDDALRAAEAVRARRNTVLQYPGGDQHLSGAALWAAERKSLSPDEGAAVETPLAAFEAALARVESRLEKRVQQAADEIERLLPTTQPYSHGRPDYRVPALGDERLEELGQLRLEPADAFVEATVAELRERYAWRARYDTPDKLRYSPQDRLESEREHLGGVVEMTCDRERRSWSPSSTSPQPTRSSALARVVKKYVLKIWEIVLVACDKILGGDLGERLRRRRERIEKAADVAERLLPTMYSISCASPVPVAGDAGLAGVVTDTTAPVVGDAVEVVWARYYRRSPFETPSERRYSAVDRGLAAKAYLAFSLDVAEARQQREGLRSDSSVLPPLDAARAIVLEEHQSSLRQIFAVACDEVFGPGELATRWRRRRDQVRCAVDVVEAGLQTTRLGWPDRDVPALSHETSIALVAAEADPRRRAMWRELGERCHRRASLGTTYEHRYSADDRTKAERAHLAVAFNMARGRYVRGWVRSVSSAALPPPAPTRASILEEHRSNLRNIFKLALDEVSGGGELGKRRCLRRETVRRAVDAAEAALPTTRPHPVVRPDHHVPALSDNTWDALFDVETDPFRKAMWRELGERYHRRDSLGTPYDQYYSAEDRSQSEQAHLNEVSTKKYERQLQTWRSSTRELARPTLADAEASVLKDHQAEISGIFTTARDEVLRGDAVRARRQEEPDRPVGSSKAARGDAVPVSEGSSAGSLQPKAEIAGARQAQASSREEKPAPAAAEPPTPDVVELVAKDSEQNVLPIFNGTLAVSNGQLDDIECCIGNNRDAGYEVALEAVERIRQVHQHDAAARAATETAHYAPAARKRRWRKLLSSATEELMWEMAIEHAGKITDVCRERLGLRDDGDTGGGAPPSPKRLEPPDPGAAGSGGGQSVKTPAPLPPADGDRGPRR